MEAPVQTQLIGWTTERTAYSVMHHLFGEDSYKHRKSFLCPCRPQIEAMVAEDAFTVWWAVTHNHLDGQPVSKDEG